MSNFMTVRMPESEKRRFKKWTKKLSDENRKKCQTYIGAAVFRIERMAKMFVPGPKGILRGSIHHLFTANRLGGAVYTNVYYAPYVEFGTGRFAAQFTAKNPDIAAYAMTFYVNGLGRQRAQPYLFPAVRIAQKELFHRLEAMGFKRVA